MSITSTNYADFSYIEEVAAGVTPATPAFQRLPVVNVGLADSLGTSMSEVIRSDRQTDDLVVVDSEVGGDNSYELSFTPFLPLLQALLQNGAGTTVAIAAADDIVADNSGSQFTSSTTDFTTENLNVGDFVRVSGCVLDTANNGVYRVTSVAANALGVFPAPASDQAAEASVDMDGQNIRNGAATPKSYTFRKQLNAPGGTDAIFYYRGCMINSMSFNFETGSILNGSMNVVGLTSEGTATAIADETLTAIQAYDIMNSVSSISSIDISGLPATTEFSNLNLTINNQINAAKAIGTLGAVGLAPFSLDITGDLEIYFEDTTVYNLYKNATSFSVAITLVDGSGNNIVVYLPKCKFEDLSEPVEGKDNFLMESGSLKALRDETTDMMVQFTLIPA